MFKISEMTKEEKIGVLITFVYILYMLGDTFGNLSRYNIIRGRHIFSELSDFIINQS